MPDRRTDPPADPGRVPDVSVVVIVYNDAAHLPRAVGSVLGQTLRNLEVVVVDDASTDDTPAVAARLAAADPDRVRVVRLPANSGGCSRPRNVGIEHARGRYVMFLDSDDALERHACKTMLVTAEETGVDVVTGQVIRIHADRQGRVTRWFTHVYEHYGVYPSAREHPVLFDDMLSTNKCYRRGFLLDSGIRFPEGLLYEDLLFTTQVYLRARGIAVVPQVVYHWYVLGAAGASITHRRHEFKNFADRITIHRMIDRLMDEYGTPGIRRVKDSRFLRHDLRLYLNELPDRDEAYVEAFLDLAAGYLDGLDPGVLDEVNPVLAITVFMIRKHDAAGVLSAVDYLNRGRTLSTLLAVRDGRVYWTDRYLDTDEGRHYLDVTDLGLHEAPFDALHLYSRVTGLAVDGSALLVEGWLLDQLGRVPPEARLAMLVRPAGRRLGRRRPVRPVPVEQTGRDGSHVRWRTRLPVAELVSASGLRDAGWDLVMRVEAGGRRNDSPVSAGSRSAEALAVPVRVLAGRRERVETHVTARGHLALRLRPANPAATAVRAGTAAALRTPQGAAARRLAGYLVRTGRALPSDVRLKRAAYERLLVRLPTKKGRIVFESHLGKQYSDSPRRIYEEIRARGLPYECVWGYERSPAGFPTDALLLRRYSWRYLVALARAEFWVDNAGLPPLVRKRPDQTYVQTWHGTALKVMGFDVPSVKQSSKKALESLERQAGRWDYFLVRCEHDVDTLLPAFRARAEPLRYGYPRNDVLVAAQAAEARAAALERLGLPSDRRIVLYAPTYRHDHTGERAPFAMHVDLDRFAAELGDTHLLLVRPHYLDSYVVPPRHARSVRNVAGVHDVSDLLAVTDVLVTDYSSVMFDFAVTRRPIVFFTYDYDDYVAQTRGTYVDLAEVAPGPLVSTSDELVDALRDVDAWSPGYAERYAQFVKRFAEYDDGHATERVVDRFFADAPPAGRSGRLARLTRFGRRGRSA